MPGCVKILLCGIVLVCAAFAGLFRNDRVYRATFSRLWVIVAELFIGLTLVYRGWCGVLLDSMLAVLVAFITSGCCLMLGSVIGTLASDDDKDK